MYKSIIKKALALMLIALAFSGIFSVNATSSQQDNLLGDSNEDGVVNIRDATAIQKHLADITALSQIGRILSDADMNKTLSIKDATTIQKWLAGIKVKFPIGDAFDISGIDITDTKDIVTTVYSYDCTHSPSHSKPQNGNTYSYRIPQINLDYISTQKINDKITEYYSYLKSINPCSQTDAMSLFSLNYDWAVNDDILSFYTYGKSYLYNFYNNVWNISVSTGQIIPHEEVRHYAGYTEEEYRSRVKEVIASGYIEYFRDWGDNFIENQLPMFSHDIQKTLSDENLKTFRVILNKNGELCIIGYLYYPAGSGKLNVIYNLDTYQVNQEYIDIVNGLSEN